MDEMILQLAYNSKKKKKISQNLTELNLTDFIEIV